MSPSVVEVFLLCEDEELKEGEKQIVRRYKLSVTALNTIKQELK